MSHARSPAGALFARAFPVGSGLVQWGCCCLLLLPTSSLFRLPLAALALASAVLWWKQARRKKEGPTSVSHACEPRMWGRGVCFVHGKDQAAEDASRLSLFLFQFSPANWTPPIASLLGCPRVSLLSETSFSIDPPLGAPPPSGTAPGSVSPTPLEFPPPVASRGRGVHVVKVVGYFQPMATQGGKREATVQEVDSRLNFGKRGRRGAACWRDWV